MDHSIPSLLQQAIAHREHLFDSRHEIAFRLFNGFTEGYPDLALDIYGSTLLIQNYADEPIQSHAFIQEVTEYLRNTITWLRAGILKTRNARTQEEKNGRRQQDMDVQDGAEPDNCRQQMQVSDDEPDHVLGRYKPAVLAFHFLGLKESFADRRQLPPADDINVALPALIAGLLRVVGRGRRGGRGEQRERTGE